MVTIGGKGKYSNLNCRVELRIKETLQRNTGDVYSQYKCKGGSDPNYSTEGGGNTPEVVCQLPKKDGHSQFSK